MNSSQFGIIISNSEPLLNGALKLVGECGSHGIRAEIIKIENIRHKAPESLPLCLYSLTNINDLNTPVSLLMRRDYDVINGMYYQQRFDKISMQACLKSAGIRVPEFYPMNLVSKIKSLMDTGTRFLAKTNGHMGKQEILSQCDTLARFQDSITVRGEYYAEKFINAEDEHKLYVVGKKVFLDHDKLDARMHQIIQITDAVCAVSMLEVFSVDILREIETHDLFVIDVNPASAFYLATDARIQFVEYINNKLASLKLL